MPNLSNRINYFGTYKKPLAAAGLFVMLILVITLLTSCKGNTEVNRELIADKIQYDVLVKNPNPDYDWWIENLPGPQRDELVSWIFKMAESGEIAAWDYFDERIEPGEIKKIGVDTIYRTLMRDVPPFEEYDTMIVTHLEKKDITKVRFLERWYWNADRTEIEKEVIGIAPVLRKLDDEGNFLANFPLFWLYLDEDYPVED